MAVCKEIDQSVEVHKPIASAQEDWTQFAFQQNYLRPSVGLDASETGTDGRLQTFQLVRLPVLQVTSLFGAPQA